MSFKLNFRVVGLYLDFRDLTNLKDATGAMLTPTATVIDIMRAIRTQKKSFDFDSYDQKDPDICSWLSYEFQAGSKVPDNAQGEPDKGPRKLENHLSSDINRVWQYYRGAKVRIDGKIVDVNFPTSGQPPFTTLSLNDGYDLGVEPESYSLTWRLVTIDGMPEGRRQKLDRAMQASRASAVRGR
jgi:hypothetical protein